MQPRLQLLPSWTDQLHQLVPGLRITRLRVLALFSLGLIWAETTALGRIAATLPCAVQDLSTERRLRRWLANRSMPVVPTWQPILGALLARLGQQEVLVIFDPTPYRDDWTILILTLVVGRRALPIAWHIVPQQQHWDHATWRYLDRLARRVDAALPAGTTVTLLADRGLTSAGLIDLCAQHGWHYTLRVSASEQHGVHARLADGTRCPLWDLVPGVGRRWDGQVEVYQAAGWRTVQLTIRWARAAKEPWLLLSDRPAGPERVAEYRRRTHCEAFYQDTKSRGWQLESSRLTERNRLNRLLLVISLAAWWLTLLGQQVIRRGLRQRFDRRDRRDLSLMRLGRRWVTHLLDHGLLPPLPFRERAGRWSLRWLL
jgi:Transposase DDE domain